MIFLLILSLLSVSFFHMYNMSTSTLDNYNRLSIGVGHSFFRSLQVRQFLRIQSKICGHSSKSKHSCIFIKDLAPNDIQILHEVLEGLVSSFCSLNYDVAVSRHSSSILTTARALFIFFLLSKKFTIAASSSLLSSRVEGRLISDDAVNFFQFLFFHRCSQVR